MVSAYTIQNESIKYNLAIPTKKTQESQPI